MNHNTRKLKVAVIVDKRCFYNWHNTVLQHIKDSSHTELVVIVNASQTKSSKKSPFLWKLFKGIDNKLFKPSPYALSSIDFEKKVQNITIVDYSEDSISKDIHDLELDVIIDFNASLSSIALAKSSKYGIWFLTNSDLNSGNKQPYGIWEMIHKKPKSVAVLRYLKDENVFPETIDETSSCTDLLSYKRNINSLLWQAHFLILNNLKLLATNEALFIEKLERHKTQYQNLPSEATFLPPKNATILAYALRLYGKKIKQQINSAFYFSQWAMIFLNAKGGKNPYDLKSYTKILPPKDRFWADPFLIKENGKTYLFIEELIYKNKLGHLSVMEIRDDGTYTTPEKILVKDYHLSYPFVFKDNEEYYMIPETSGNKDIQLYKAKNFPLDWELKETLMRDLVAVDTTIYKDNDQYWMFTSQKNHKGASKNVELFLYSSNDLASTNWTPHPLNPVVRSVETARPAGAIFQKDGRLFRSSQICSRHYGYGLNIIEITKLSETDYQERIDLQILPNWDKSINATHTFNKVDDLYISDIKIKRSRIF